MNGTVPLIHTIGYQNLSIDEFVNILKQRNIKLVIDVRNNPFSFKQGFSKKWLITNLPNHGIRYVNIPELGIPSKYRKELNGRALWHKYNELLRLNVGKLESAAQIVKKQSAVLMCFEADHTDCHRSILAEKLKGLTGLTITHYCQTINAWSGFEEKFSLP